MDRHRVGRDWKETEKRRNARTTARGRGQGREAGGGEPKTRQPKERPRGRCVTARGYTARNTWGARDGGNGTNAGTAAKKIPHQQWRARAAMTDRRTAAHEHSREPGWENPR